MEVFNTMIKGIGASSGIAIAKAYKLVMPDLKKLLLKTYQLKKLLYLMLMH